jgi:hypothetical protein
VTEIPTWLYQPVQENDEDRIANDIFSLKFWSIWDGKEDTIKDVYAISRATAESVSDSFTQTLSLTKSMERAGIRLLVKLRDEGLLPFLPGEYDSIKSFLLAKLDPNDTKTSDYYDITFMVDTLIPALQASGMPVDKVLGLAQGYSKARVAVKPLRHALEQTTNRVREIQEEMEQHPDRKEELEPKLQEAWKVDNGQFAIVEELFTGISDEQLSVNAFKEKLHGVTHKDVPMIQCLHCMTLDGDVIYIKGTPEQTRAVQMALKNISEWHEGTTIELLREMKSMITKE